MTIFIYYFLANLFPPNNSILKQTYIFGIKLDLFFFIFTTQTQQIVEKLFVVYLKENRCHGIVWQWTWFSHFYPMFWLFPCIACKVVESSIISGDITSITCLNYLHGVVSCSIVFTIIIFLQISDSENYIFGPKWSNWCITFTKT